MDSLNLRDIIERLSSRKHYLLYIIDNTNMTLYTVYNMDPDNLVKNYEILTKSTDPRIILLAQDELLIWEKYRCQLELNFLNQQIKHYNDMIIELK